MEHGRDWVPEGSPNRLGLQLLQLQGALSKTLRIDLAPGCVHRPKASKLVFLNRLAEGQGH